MFWSFEFFAQIKYCGLWILKKISKGILKCRLVDEYKNTDRNIIFSRNYFCRTINTFFRMKINWFSLNISIFTFECGQNENQLIIDYLLIFILVTSYEVHWFLISVTHVQTLKRRKLGSFNAIPGQIILIPVICCFLFVTVTLRREKSCVFVQ